MDRVSKNQPLLAAPLWPESISVEATETLIQEFFTLIDSESEAGAKAFSELFAKDGSFVTGKHEFHGRQGMRRPVNPSNPRRT